MKPTTHNAVPAMEAHGKLDGAAVIANFEIVKTVRKIVEVRNGGNGSTFGNALDSIIGDAIREGHEISSITFIVTPEQWKDIV